jgi:predicted aconitase
VQGAYPAYNQLPVPAAQASQEEVNMPLELSDAQKQMLDGNMGEPVRQGMELTVELAKFWEAPDLIPVRSVHVVGAGVKTARRAGRKYVRWVADEGAQMVTICTLNPSATDQTGIDIGVSQETLQFQREITDSYTRMGAIECHTCTPYLIGNAPRFGEHICWGESSAVLYANSVLGARTNREGAPSALAAALTGFTAGYGMHFKENRLATIHVDINYPLDDISDYACAGYYLAKHYPDSLPVFTGFPARCPTYGLKTACAAMGSSGAVSMFHAVGITPEAPTLEAATGGRKIETITLGPKERDETIAFLNRTNASSEVDCVFIGCPHLDFEEIAQLTALLKGRKVKPGLSLWLFAANSIWNSAERSGLLQPLRDAGAVLISGTCAVSTMLNEIIISKGFTSAATNSAKIAHYLPSSWGLKIHYGTTADNIEAAVTGKWNV